MPIKFENRTGQGGFTLSDTTGAGGFDIVQVSAYVPPPPSVTPSVSITPSASTTPSVTVSVTPSITVSTTPSVSVTPSITVSATPSVSVTPSVTISSTPSISVTPSITISVTPSVSITPSITTSTTPSVSVTPSISVTRTPSVSVTPSISISATPSVSVTPSISVSATPSVSVTPSVTPTRTPSASVTPSITPTPSTSPLPQVVSSGLTWHLDASNESLATNSAWYNIINTGLYALPQSYNGGSNPVITTSGGIRYYQYTGTYAPAAAFLGGGFHVLSTTPATDYSTTSIWFNNNTNSPKVLALGSTGNESSLLQGVEFYLNGLAIGQMSTRITTSGTSNSDLHSPYNYNQWYQLTQTFDGSTQAMYINGSLYTSKSLSGVQNKPNRSYGIGAKYGASNTPELFMNGAIGHYLIYNRALTSAEVLQNYNATKAKFGL